MNKLASVLLCLIVGFACVASADDDIWVGGYKHSNVQVEEFDGITTSDAPSISSSGTARQFFDSTLGTLRCSEDGASYSDCIGGNIDTDTTVTGFTTGSILFVDSATTIAEDNAHLFWNDVTDQLMVGTTTAQSTTNPLVVYKDHGGFTRIELNNPDASNTGGTTLRFYRGSTHKASIFFKHSDNSWQFDNNAGGDFIWITDTVEPAMKLEDAGHLSFPNDNQNVTIGALTGGDLIFNHDGTNSNINSNTGNLLINLLASGGLLEVTTDATGTSIELMRLVGNNKTGADGDKAAITYFLDGNTGNSEEVGRMIWNLSDVDFGEFDGFFSFETAQFGVNAEVIRFGSDINSALFVGIDDNVELQYGTAAGGDVSTDFDTSNWVFDLKTSGGFMHITTGATGTSNEVLRITGNNKTGATNDDAFINYVLNDNAGNDTIFCRQSWVATDVGTEEGMVTWDCITAGSLEEVLRFGFDAASQGFLGVDDNIEFQLGSAAGGDVEEKFNSSDWIHDLKSSGGNFTITTDASGTSNLLLRLVGNDKVGAVGDEAYISMVLDHDFDAEREFARITWEANDPLDVSFDGEIRLSVAVNSTMTDILTVGSTTAGVMETKVTGTLEATGVIEGTPMYFTCGENATLDSGYEWSCGGNGEVGTNLNVHVFENINITHMGMTCNTGTGTAVVEIFVDNTSTSCQLTSTTTSDTTTCDVDVSSGQEMQPNTISDTGHSNCVVTWRAVTR